MFFEINQHWENTTPPAGLSIHMVLCFAWGRTNPSAPQEVAAEAFDFIVNVVCPKVMESTKHEDFILNMDQTPVPFTYNARKTLEIVGHRTVHIRKSTCDTKRVTFAMTMTASGKVLKPVIILKGFETAELSNVNFRIMRMATWCTSANALLGWMKLPCWSGLILCFSHTLNRHHLELMPILFLDSYRCHMMAGVVTRIQNLGVEVVHIPGGCTSLCQPVDIGVNKPFKNRLRSEWQTWMINEGNVKCYDCSLFLSKAVSYLDFPQPENNILFNQ
jgi:DDE superfamily endonuclease